MIAAHSGAAACPATRLLSRGEVMTLLDLAACIEAVEAAFLLAGEGKPVPSAILGLAARDGGLHVKAALLAEREGAASGYFAAKVNANFTANPVRELPTIQGGLALFDSATGVPLAVVDSTAITILRTAAA